MNKWIKTSEYVNKMSTVKMYLGLQKGFGGVTIVSGNTSKDYIIDHFDAICPIPVEGMSEFRKDTHNYGESTMVSVSSLKVGDKIYYNYEVLTVKKIQDNKIKFDVQGIVIDDLSLVVEKL